MPLRARKPTSAGRRFQTVSDFSDITRSEPERSLIGPKPSSGGRNSYGRKTSRHRGGGHKQQYRQVDFRRDKDGVPAKVAAVESVTGCNRVRAPRSGRATPSRSATSRWARSCTAWSSAPEVEANWPVGRG